MKVLIQRICDGMYFDARWAGLVEDIRLAHRYELVEGVAIMDRENAPRDDDLMCMLVDPDTNGLIASDVIANARLEAEMLMEVSRMLDAADDDTAVGQFKKIVEPPVIHGNGVGDERDIPF